ncbi:MAG: hypothetical protein LBQ45_00110 [Mycoplasmataceae bacterium]|jgi:outer membrane murein-binding lipoprotein Lpp|nr:hypothetical protein [Mycoplasmataceae bacterium]
MTLRELNMKVDKIETTVSELAKIVQNLSNTVANLNNTVNMFITEQRCFNQYVLDVFARNNLK